MPELSHSYAEVRAEGTWCAIDSYIVDAALLKAAQTRLAKEGRSLGYGTRVDSTNVWDGRSNTFSQFDHGITVEDHGPVDDVEAYFRTRKYRNQILGMRLNTLLKLVGDRSVAPINAHLEGIRTSSIE